MENFKPSEQAVLDAIRALGHGNVHHITDSAGFARSTVDKAITVLRTAGLIVEYDTGADPAEGTPIQWQLADTEAASTPIGTNAETHGETVDTPDADLTEHGQDDVDRTAESIVDPAAEGTDQDEDDDDGDEDDEDEDEEDGDGDGDDKGAGPGAASASRPKNRRVMVIAGAIGFYPGGATIQDLLKDTDIPMPSLDRLLTVMVAGGAAVLIDDTRPRRWRLGTTHPADINPYPVTPRCGDCQRTIPAGWTPPTASTEGEGRTAPDARVLTLAGAMFTYGDGGASVSQLADDSRFTPELVARLLSAMRTAGVAVRVITGDGDGEQTGEPLWLIKPGPLNTVDLEPKCSGCHRPLPGSRPSRTSRPSGGTGTRRPDALPRNVLKDATLRFILERPGIDLSPGAIAGALAVELNRDKVSPGAVKNNCVGFASEGKIRQVSSNPWLFSALPTTAEDTTGGEGTSTDDESANDAAAQDTGDNTTTDGQDTDQ